MRARAEAAEATRLHIIEAAIALFMERDLRGMTLEAVAERAGVTLQTVLRRFGSKAGLVAAATEHKAAQVQRMRTPERAGDVRAALRALVSTYEELGDLNWRMLCHEAQDPALHTLLERARAVHSAWLEQVFAAHLPARGAERKRRLALLFAATDFYVWKLSRRDLDRSREETERSMRELVEALLERFARE